MWEYNNLDELYHYGILGMHWGVRRYQNKDGSLTQKGKQRRMSQDAKEVDKIKKKKLYEMSNEELKKYNNRKSLENSYHQNNKNAILNKKLLAGAATAALLTTTYVTLKNNGKTIISDGKNIVNFAKSKLG